MYFLSGWCGGLAYVCKDSDERFNPAGGSQEADRHVTSSGAVDLSIQNWVFHPGSSAQLRKQRLAERADDVIRPLCFCLVAF